ncbi:TrlF family AAA-like ATPase [Sedimentitalea nanhaiensis]|uniref:AAA domain-containing protein n=1 Tax=Sedimentitalea nanhaiensis TaxID=999627 RepID=A0A1I7B0G4_9RHOB|nr:AAA family ATPase [Sedimentitalea nanhaiensis]SFT80681.1 AAA domain-containing protein [Sedimentitalea nanhaiensis]
MEVTYQHDSSLETLIAHTATPKGIVEALGKPSGSRFYRCAFQVNPHQYGQRHAKDAGFSSEDDYNDAVAKACRENGIQVVAVTDHFRFDSSEKLAERLRADGIVVFPGFEANSSEGVHILCLFPPETTGSEMNTHIGACEVRDLKAESPISNKTCEQLMRLVQELGGIAISAHVTSAAGMLKNLSGQTRMNVWKSDYHLAAAIPGPVEDVPTDYSQICKNKDAQHKRSRAIAFVNASDVSKPDDFKKDSATCLVKMTDVSIEGLKQAFLDAEGRILLNSDGVPSDYTRLVALSWDRGLLSEQSVALNAGLNVLIGGRGAGKSTVVESIRYAFGLEPKGKDASATHKAMMKELMGQKASVAVLLHSPRPSPGYYLVERVYGQDPRVKDQNGDIINDLKPIDLVPGLEVYGQHEISELTRDKAKLAELLKRFVGDDDRVSVAMDNLRSRLRESRGGIAGKRQKIEELNEALAALPGLREKLKRFQATNLKEHAEEKTAVQAEARLIEKVAGMVAELEAQSKKLRPTQDTAEPVLPNETDQKLPHRSTLEPLQRIVQGINDALRSASDTLTTAHKATEADLAAVKTSWEPLRDAANKRFEDLKALLAEEGHNPDEYVSLDDQVARLEPKQAEKQGLEGELASLRQARQGIIDEWEKADTQAYTELEKAAKRVSKKLKGTVKAVIQPSSTIEPLREVFRSHVDGNISQAFGKLEEVEALSLSKLAERIRDGAQALMTEYGFTETSARKIADAGEALALEVEECRIPPEALIELNVGRDGSDNWKRLENLSAGQKATAVLLLLLLDADAPLIIDQPEDDLDNQFIAGRVVPIMRTGKKRRQFIFSSHNPNIPVLGDADQIIGLTPTVEDASDRTKVFDDDCGSIDKVSVQQLIKDLLEGGEQAFTTRRTKYGF